MGTSHTQRGGKPTTRRIASIVVVFVIAWLAVMVYREVKPEPLIDAVIAGDAARVSELLASGHNVNATLSGRVRGSIVWPGRTPLTWAGHFCNGEIATMLLEAGASLQPSSDRRVPTPLCLAVHHNCSEVVKVLLQYGAKPNDSCGEDPLFRIAVRQGNRELAEVLLAFGADPNDHDALEMARHNGLSDLFDGSMDK